MTGRPSASIRTPPSPADCPSCGRFIGPVAECPFCGTEAGGRLALHCLRWVALAFGVGGLFALFVASRHAELPLVRVAAMEPSMNYGQVRIRGTVVSAPRVFDRQGMPDYASFEVDDGTGRIIVAASRRTARSLVSESLLPVKGERVEATGSLAITPQQRPRLYLDSPGRLRHLDAQGTATPEPSGRPARETEPEPDGGTS